MHLARGAGTRNPDPLDSEYTPLLMASAPSYLCALLGNASQLFRSQLMYPSPRWAVLISFTPLVTWTDTYSFLEKYISSS